MSRSIDRQRIKNKGYYDALDTLSGDDSGGASQWGNLVATLANAGGEIASNVEKKKAAEKKAADDKAAAQKRDNQIKDLQDKIDAKQSEADSADADVEIKNLHAQAEKEPYGPLHTAAVQAKQKADMRHKELAALQQQLAAVKVGDPAAMQQLALQQQQQQLSHAWKMPTWSKVALGVGGGLAGLGLIYTLVKHAAKKGGQS